MSDACMDEKMIDDTAGIEFVEGSYPDVQLLSITEDAETVLATVVRGYSGDYRSTIQKDEVEHWLSDLDATALQTPVDFIHTTWLIRNVTRAWANQLVRYRVGTSFVQESLRFSRHEKVQVLLPGALVGKPAEADYR